MTYKYNAKKPFLLAYIALLCLGVVLTLGRWYSVIDPAFVIFSEEVHSHISNLSLSMIVYVGIGYSWLLFGTRFCFVTALGALLIAGNFICETRMGFMNTADILDAIYGAVGVLAAYVYLFFTHKYGLVERPLQNK